MGGVCITCSSSVRQTWRQRLYIEFDTQISAYRPDDRKWGTEAEQWRQERGPRQLTEVVTLAFISIKMSPQRKGWWSGTPMSKEKEKKKTIQATIEESFIHRNRSRLSLCACVLVRSASSCGEPMFFNLLVSHSSVCVCVYRQDVRLCPRLESLLIFLCVWVILWQERHRLLHMKCYSYKAAVAWLSPRCSARQPAGETQQSKSQREITDCALFFFFARDHLSSQRGSPTMWANNVYCCCAFAKKNVRES